MQRLREEGQEERTRRALTFQLGRREGGPSLQQLSLGQDKNAIAWMLVVCVCFEQLPIGTPRALRIPFARSELFFPGSEPLPPGYGRRVLKPSSRPGSSTESLVFAWSLTVRTGLEQCLGGQPVVLGHRLESFDQDIQLEVGTHSMY